MTGPRPRGPLDPRLLRLARPAVGALVWLVTLSVSQALAVVVIALGAAHLVVTVLDDGGGWLVPLAGLTAALLVRASTAALLPAAAHRVSARVIASARRDGLAAIARRGPAWLASRGAGGDPVDVATLLSTGLDPLRPWFATYLPALVVAGVLPPAVVALLALVDLPSAATVLVTLPLVPVFAALVGWATQRRADQQYERGGRLAGHFLDVVRGLVTLRLFNRAERQVEAVRDSSRRYARATTRVLSVAFLSSTALDLVATVSVGLVAVGAGVRLAGGEMTLWPALAAILLAPEAYRPLREAGAQFHESAQAGAVMDRLDVLLAPLDGADRDAATGPRAAAVAGSRGLVVRYPGRREPLTLPDLDVRTGQVLAVVGPSGSGKTTLLRAMAGVQRGDRGHAWAHNAEYVPQRPALPLARTVREALIAGLPASVDDGVLTAALATLALPTSTLAAGLDTALGDDATGLSAGQRHRIALARAALAVASALDATAPRDTPAPVMLLDEPTAHLDAAAERAVVAVLRDLADRGAAVIVATHRPVLAAAADHRIAVSPRSAISPDDAALPPGGLASPDNSPDDAGAGDEAVVASGSHRAGANGYDGGAHGGAPDPVTDSAATTPPPRSLLAGPRRRWTRLTPRTRFALASAAGAASLLSGIGLTVAAAWMIVRADSQPPILTLSVSVVAVRAFAIARPLWRYLERLASHDAGLSLLADWRAQVVADLVPRVPGRLTARRGALLVRVVDDVEARLSGRVRGAVPLAAGTVTLAVVALGTAWLLPAALVPLALGTAIAGVLAPWLAVRADRRVVHLRDAARTDLQDAVVGSVENVEELGTARGRSLLAEIEERGTAAEAAERDAARIDGCGRGLAELGAAVLASGAGLVAALTWTSGLAGPETVGIVTLTALALTETLLTVLPAVRAVADGRAAGARLDALDDDPSRFRGTRRLVATRDTGQQEVEARAAVGTLSASRSAPMPGVCSAGGSGSLGSSWSRGLHVGGLHAGWDAGSPVLRGLDLDVAAGETVEIRWPSGAGKSTLAAVVTGLLPPLSGEVRVGDHVLTAGSTPSGAGARLRRVVGLAGEPDHVFATTVRENLRLARPEASDQDLRSALHAAHLGGWLDGLEEGLDTWLDSGGRTLSGGERRRLVLARALLRDPDVLILDEPTSGLEEATATTLLTDLRRDAAQRGRALLVMTHRSSEVLREHVVKPQ